VRGVVSTASIAVLAFLTLASALVPACSCRRTPDGATAAAPPSETAASELTAAASRPPDRRVVLDIARDLDACTLGHRGVLLDFGDPSMRASLHPGSLGRADVLILDDWGLEPLDAAARHDILEILDDRYGRRSTVVTSQLPLERWHQLIGDPTYADAILDRLVHNANRLELEGESLRRTRPQENQKS